jgi:hypothetical protein
MKLDELILQSGNDVPFPEAQVTIHPPRIQEIAYIGEENFLIGSHFLLFDKNNLSDEDKIGLEDQSNFHILMSVMNSQEKAKHKTDGILVLTLLFPQYEIKIQKDRILLQKDKFSSSINEQNYESFKKIIKQIFCLETEEDCGEFNPADALAKRIAEKIKKGRQAKNQLSDSPKDFKIYSRYVSILSVGLGKNKNELINYTVYQLNDEFKRYQAKINWDYYLKAKLAGAENLEEVDNWMEDIHP